MDSRSFVVVRLGSRTWCDKRWWEKRRGEKRRGTGTGTGGWYQGCTRAWRLHIQDLHGGDTEGYLSELHGRRARECGCN